MIYSFIQFRISCLKRKRKEKKKKKMNCFYPKLTSCGSGDDDSFRFQPILKKNFGGFLDALKKSRNTTGRPHRGLDAKKQRSRKKPSRNKSVRKSNDIQDDNGSPTYINSTYNHKDELLSRTITSRSTEEDETLYPASTEEWSLNTTKFERGTYLSRLHERNLVYENEKYKSTVKFNKTYYDTTHHRSNTSSPPSPTDSIESTEAVKVSSRKRFQYIRVNDQQNSRADPPSDKSLMTFRSIRADDAGSILFKKYPRRQQNELARQIIQQRDRKSVV